MPRVSVVIPTYNRAGFIERAVRSVLAQTYRDLEVLVVDDASTDTTDTVLRSLQGEDPRVHCFRHETNRGSQAARNTGCRAAEGEYVAFLDSDNEWLPDKLTSQMELFERRGTKPGVAYCGFRVLYPDGRFFDMHPSSRGYVYQEALDHWLTDTSVLVVDRETLAKVGFWDERIRAYQEWDMCIRLARVADYDYVPDILVMYWRHAQQRISSDRFHNALGHLEVVETHRQEIVRLCGRRTLSEHYFKIGQQFALEAHEPGWAIRALSRCLRAYPLHRPALGLLFRILRGATASGEQPDASRF